MKLLTRSGLACSLLGFCLLSSQASAQVVTVVGTTNFEYGNTTGSGNAAADGITYRLSGGAGTAWLTTPLSPQAGATYLEITNASVRNFSTLFSSALTGNETSASLSLNLGFNTGTVFGTGLFNIVLFADVDGNNFYTVGGTEDIKTLGLSDFTAPATAGTFESVALSFAGIDTSGFVGKNLGFLISARTSNASTESFLIDGPVSLSTTSAVPEPSSYALIGGLLALGFVTFRRRSRK